MLLTVDIGNTNIALGLFEGTGEDARMVRNWRMRTDARMTADEMALIMRGLIGRYLSDITGVSALSTVPSLLHELRTMLDRYWGGMPHVIVEPGVR
ncbi:MAG: type III pantothenate kinase, partial [Mycobacteriaceae bacterium]